MLTEWSAEEHYEMCADNVYRIACSTEPAKPRPVARVAMNQGMKWRKPVKLETRRRNGLTDDVTKQLKR